MFYRSKSKFTAENFCEDLGKNLDTFYFNLPELTNDNFSENFQEFTNIVSLTIDKRASLKKLSRPQLKLCNKPCLINRILISIKNKRKMFKLHFLFETERAKSYFKNYINVLTKIETIMNQN